MKNIFKNNRGYAFIEMIVSVGLFSVVFLMVSSIYLSMANAQRSVVATQDIQESMKFILEVMSKELRSAQKSDEDCGAGLVDISPSNTYERDPYPKKVFNITNSGAYNSQYLDNNQVDRVEKRIFYNELLYFEDKYGDCVYYFTEIDPSNGVSRLKIKRGSTALYVTPASISIENLLFYVWDDEAGSFHSSQPYVTIKMDVESHGGKEMHKQRTSLQTTISSRYYE